MKKIISILLVVFCVAGVLGGCSSEELEIKEFVKDYYEIDSDMEAEMIKTVSELKELGELAETTEEKVNFADSVNEYRKEFSDAFEENYKTVTKNISNETDGDLKEKHYKFAADYNSLSVKGLDFFKYATGQIDEDEYYEVAVEYLNEYAKTFLTGFDDKDLIG